MTYQEYFEEHPEYKTDEEKKKAWSDHCYEVQNEKMKVGEGATVYYWTDAEAYTIIKRTKYSMTLRKDKATLSPDFKPIFIPGGFCGTVINQDEQSYSYEEDPDGIVIIARWSKAKNGFYWKGLKVGSGRHKFYDYNF